MAFHRSIVVCATMLGGAGCGGSVAATSGGPVHDADAPSIDGATPVVTDDASPPSPPPTPEIDSGSTPGDGASVEAATSDATDPFPAEPPPYPKYSGGTCPKLSWGSTSDSSVVDGFVSSGDKRSFRLLVPKSYDATKKYPVMFAWHWLNASSASFVRDGELETAVEQMQFIAVLPDDLKDDKGKKAYTLDWPFAETWGAPKELTFFDDLLACVDQQLSVDHARVYGVGVSAGGLWVSYLSTTPHVKWLAAVESLSGGLGEEPIGFKMTYAPQPNKFPALVLWGGPSDWLGLSFQDASTRYRDALIADHHFVVTCTHDKGHAMPPIPSPGDGTTKFKPLWEFMLDHTYGLPAGTSPYQKTGLPKDMPSWCKIATP